MSSCQVLLVIYGGHETSESHCIFMKLYRRPRGHESVDKAEPAH
jgi:hypothetical protein